MANRECAARRNMTETEMFGLSTWIFIGSNAYHEYTYVPSLGKNVYRRTVDLNLITLQ